MSCPLCGDICRCDPELRPAMPREQGCGNDGVRGSDPLLFLQSQGSTALRQEIAARVHRYRARRSYRPPRYPSLRLKFEPGEANLSRPGAGAPVASSEVSVRQNQVAESTAPQVRPGRGVNEPDSAHPSPDLLNVVKARDRMARELAAKVIEFPRSNMVPVPLDELAERVIDRPRILDVPEPAPPPPALGGILIAAVEEQEPEPRPGIDVPLQSAAVEDRLLAAGVDACIVLVASTVFGYLWFRITHMRPSFRFGLVALAGVTGFFWAAYQYLFMVYSGTTLGLKSARLQLRRFDGTAPTRSLRRWRVLVSFLSAASLGMGFLWCFLDEDALCWHDRMTRTYLAPKAPPQGEV